MTNVIPSSSADIIADPQRFLDEMRKGRIINLTDLGYVIAPATEIAGLADELAEEQLIEEMVSYRKNVTGVNNTLFISPKGNTRHGPRIKLAIDPPDSIDPRGNVASIAIDHGTVVAGEVPPALLEEVRRFIDANRAVLLDYWEYRIDTETLRRRLKSV
ncbi:MAG: DUF4160 domain-containing protein [Hyphomicrobiales bacterium]|nr:DUF4160 domain-containing protein [Hyphomicrobiales bacterium]MBV9426258.1 DUF4160 domain-containing protein [Bradyrhizobiaceae bacterium]